MQKRDKFGRFLKRKASKKKAKKVKVSVAKKRYSSPKLSDLSFYDLQDIIAAEVQLQMKEIW